MSPLGLRLKELRDAKGWSQRELSRRSGVRQATISHLETGKARTLSLVALEKLARALGCDPGYLIVKRAGRH